VLVAHSAVEDSDVEALDLGTEDRGVLEYLLGQLARGSYDEA